jgi:hypothetical protein
MFRHYTSRRSGLHYITNVSYFFFILMRNMRIFDHLLGEAHSCKISSKKSYCCLLMYTTYLTSQLRSFLARQLQLCKAQQKKHMKCPVICLPFHKHFLLSSFSFCNCLYSTMKRLYWGHLHPKLEVLRLTVPAGNQTRASAVGGEPFEQLMLLLFGTSTWLSKCMWPLHMA